MCLSARTACNENWSISMLWKQLLGRLLSNTPKEERLAHLEEKLDRLLSSRLVLYCPSYVCGTRTDVYTRQDHPPLQERPSEEAIDPSDKSVSVSPPAQDVIFKPIITHTTPPAQPTIDVAAKAGPGPADVGLGIRLYFEYCHRQPIWCFEYEDVSDYTQLSEELACSILALTARFSPMRERLQKYNINAKRLVMLRIASSTVEVSTIESLCLLAYSSFIGNYIRRSISVNLC